jgi:hypothetical protein
VFTALFGSTQPFDSDQLTRLYPGGRDGYLSAFEQRLEVAVKAGFVLAVDRDEIMSLASAACPLT